MSKPQDLIERIRNYRNGFASVVPFNATDDGLMLLDFTANNKSLTKDILKDTGRFSTYITSALEGAKAKYGIGGYNEHRTIYSRSNLFSPSPTASMNVGDGAKSPSGREEGEDPASALEEETVGSTYANDQPKISSLFGLSSPTGAEARRLHLGVDIWGQAGVPVYAPLEGTVHSFAFNSSFGDYGATLILQHEIEDLIFHTLYGHLSLKSIEHKREGQSIEKGEWIANFGEPAENGYWPPHLHFQIIKDMNGWKGDYPGVCAYSEKENYLANCPDGDLLLNMIQHANPG